MSHIVKSGTDFVNCLRCPECFAQVMAIEPAVIDEPAPRSHAYLIRPPSHIGYDLSPCGCFLPATDFMLVQRVTETGNTVEFERNLDCGCKK